ncbi:MAG: CDP-alcohol phosphatidyltransferase family protein [Phycisphaerales bacterium]
MPSDSGTGGVSAFRVRLPNLLTASRLVMALVFFVVLAPWSIRTSPLYRGAGVDWTLLAAAAIFVVAAITDALDGYLARKWNVVSIFGRVMDPFADKVLVLGAFVLLAGPGFSYEWVASRPSPASAMGLGRPAEIWHVHVSGVHPWMVVVILARELLVTSIRGVVESQGKSFAATASGKLKMIMQCVCIPAVLLLLNVPPGDGEVNRTWPWWAIQVIVVATVIVTAWSGVPYVVRGFAALRSSKPLDGGGA